MALLYPWATKEYLLWQMSIGQIVMYHNLGIEIKYPKPPSAPGSGPSIKSSRKEIKAALAQAKELKTQSENASEKERYREKYGDI
jgi:hypothetical protein